MGLIFYVLVVIFEDTVVGFVYFSFEIFKGWSNRNLSVSGYFYFALR